MKQLQYLSNLNIFGILSILIALFFLVFGTALFVRNSERSLKWAILYLFASFCIWCFSHGCLLLSPSPEYAYAFNAVGCFGFDTIFSAIITFFICLKHEHLSTQHKLAIGLNNAVSIYLIISTLFFGNRPVAYIMTASGWRDCPPIDNIHYKIYTLAEIVWIFEMLYLVIDYRIYTKKKGFAILIKQANIIMWTGITSLVVGVLSNNILPLLNVQLPAFGTIVVSIWLAGLGIAITRYRFLMPTLAYATADIFKLGGEIMIVTDTNFNIIEANDFCLKTLGYTKDEIRQENLSSLLMKRTMTLPSSIDGSGNMFESKLYTKDNKMLYVNVKASPIYNQQIIIGVLYILSDVTLFKNQNEMLEKRIIERTGQITKHLTIMQYYTRPSLIKAIQEGKDPTKFKPKTENKAVLFTDLRNFTTISERLTSEETVNFLNAYFNEMSVSITNCNGEIDKLIGDCIMALFNTSDDAVASAIDLRKRLKNFNDLLKLKGRRPVDIGTGINFGLVNVGNLGSHTKLDYTVIGDIVNVANRMESLTKYYKTPILISEQVKKELHGIHSVRFIDEIVIKGGDSSTRIYEIYDYLDENSKVSRPLYQKTLDEAFGEYRNGNFLRAAALYHALARKIEQKGMPKDPLIAIYQKRCMDLFKENQAGLLKKWNGIYRFETK
ncbi:MAG: PAS domain-containing protein [Treponema sp.]|jgi:PAS domain S-box-containing protein|nr:PAS domain-containing protein [Treponema sp.]